MQQLFDTAHAQVPIQPVPSFRGLNVWKAVAPSSPWLAIVCLCAATVSQAQTTPPAAPPAGDTAAPKPALARVQQTVEVTATPDTIKETELTGSRLGLTPLETPAAIDIVPSEVFFSRGFQQIEDAVDSLPGVTSGGSPADPSQFVARGFVGNQVTLLRDGIYVGPANMVTRGENTFNLQSVDLLQGPASVLYGQGAVGGTVNVITRQPTFTPLDYNAYSSYGTFNTYELGIGAGGQIAKSLAFRGDFSYYASDGFIHNSNIKNLNGTGSLLWKINPQLSVRLSLDVLRDDLPSPYGTPFVTAAFGTSPIQGVLKRSDGQVLDSRMRYNNYNVGDAVLNSATYEPSATFIWQPTANITVTDQPYYYHAARNWMNAEQYIFIPQGSTDGNGGIAPINEIERDRFQVHHNQNLPGNSLNVVYPHSIFGRANKLAAGYEIYGINFSRARGFNFANNYADFVDALHPVQGSYAIPVDPGDNAKRIAPTKITDNAVYVEDALNVTAKLIAVGGIHFENFYLDRLNFGPTGAPQLTQDFSGTYHPFDLRVGAVYNLTQDLAAYGQFSTGKTPPGNNIFLVNAITKADGTVLPFQLASAKQGEVGVKAGFPRSLGEATLALYDISLDHILSATLGNSQDPNTVSSNNGQQRSKGLAFSTILHPAHLVDVNFNTAYTHARFGYYFDPNTGLLDTGLVPADVPATTTNLSADVRQIGPIHLEVGGGWRFVGGRYADNANQTRLYNYSLFNLYGSYHITEKYSLTLRAQNLLDKAYAQWADVNYPTELQLGSPRTITGSFTRRF